MKRETDGRNAALRFAREASLGMPGSIKDIADLLLGEGTGIAPLTMAQVATRAYTSKPTLVRFAKLAGYAGWPAYRHDFLAAMAEEERRQVQRMDVDVNDPFAKGSDAQSIASAIARSHRLAIEEVRNSVRPEILEAAARTLLQARHIVYLGVMHNRNRGKVFASNLAIMGLFCHVPDTSEAAALIKQLSDADCVVAVSYSGDIAHQPFNFVQPLAERGVRVIAVTNSQRSALSGLAHYTLGFSPLEHLHAKVGSFYSGACTSLILDMLYATCYALQLDDSTSNREGILQELKGLIPQEPL